MSGESNMPHDEMGDQVMGKVGQNTDPSTRQANFDDLAEAAKRHQHSVVTSRHASRDRQGQTGAEILGELKQNALNQLARLGRFLTGIAPPKTDQPAHQPAQRAPLAATPDSSRQTPTADSPEAQYQQGVESLRDVRYNTDTQQYDS